MYVTQVSGNTNQTMYRGDTRTLSVELLEEDHKTPIASLQGGILTLTLRGLYSDAVLLQLEEEIHGGQVLFRIPHSTSKTFEPGRYKYDMEYRTKDDSIVTTLFVGFWDVKEDQTRGTEGGNT